MSQPSPSILHSPSPSGITTISISRPARRNAIDPDAARTLHAAFLAFDADGSQKVCVFYGAHGTFCAGADLLQVAASAGGEEEKKVERGGKEEWKERHFGEVQGQNEIGPMGSSRMRLSKPVICAVSGYAVAGGLELALLGDMRVVEEDAKFGVFCRRFGVPLIDGGTMRLQAIVGLGRAMDMILTGRPVGAQEALQMGLANRVVPKGQAVQEAMKIAEQLVRFPQFCMRRDRLSAYYAAYDAKSFEDAMSFEFRNGIEAVHKEGVEGAQRFALGIGRNGKL